MITKELLDSLFYYDGRNLYNRGSPFRKKDKQAGNVHDGYVRVSIKNKYFREHRLVWLMHFGKLPDLFLDHIDGVRDNNALSNLRECTNQENSFNTKKLPNRTSTYKGVYFKKARNKYCARVMMDSKSKHLGYFTDEIEAAKAYDKAAREHFGKFANTNFELEEA